jgi:ribosomal protein S18 acetylase RimI-like enzyme
MRTEREKMLAGELYEPNDLELVAARTQARNLCQALNATTEADAEGRRGILRELFRRGGESVWMQPPFFCDYGNNIELGERVFFNFNCVVLDVCRVRIAPKAPRPARTTRRGLRTRSGALRAARGPRCCLLDAARATVLDATAGVARIQALAMPDTPELVLRAASLADADAIAALWHRGWIDGHLGHVPEALHAHRRLVDFQQRVPPRIPTTTVATLGREIVGFVTLQDDELEQLYVAASARGGGVAGALIRHGERLIAERYSTAWLAVAVGNDRARRFYARQGWSDVAALDYRAETAAGPIVVPCRRYEKVVR